MGHDTFVLGGGKHVGVDTVRDFNVAQDTVQLAQASFGELAVGVLAADSLAIGGAAVDANDFVVYNPTTGVLSYDADGNGAGAAVRIAVLGAGLALVNTDFVVV